MEVNWAKDIYDSRNYLYSDVCWNVDLPDYVLLDSWEFQNQAKDWYSMGCVFYSWSENDNYLNLKEWFPSRSKWSDLCDIAKEKWLWSPTDWAYLINAPKLLKEKWLIDWYTQVTTHEEIKQSLANKKPVHTWSSQINRTETKKAPFIAVMTWWASHCFHIIGYDDSKKLYICKNSYWNTNYDKWLFYINYSDLDCLMNTRISFINKNEKTNLQIIKEYRVKMKNYKKSYDEFLQDKSVKDYKLRQIAFQANFGMKINTKI